MSKDAPDRRVQKTLKLLQDALISLISEKGFESVSIQEILDRANVGRSTFYFHFGNKYELLHSCFEDFCNLFEQHSADVSNRKQGCGENDLIFSLFRFVEQNHRPYKAVLGMEGMTMISNPIHQYIYNYINDGFKKSLASKAKPPIEKEMLANFVTSAFIGTLYWWVHKDMPCSAEEAVKYFKRFAMYDINELL